MFSRLAQRMTAAIAIALVAGIIVAILAGIETAAVTVIGGIAAGLAAMGVRGEDAVAVPTSPDDGAALLRNVLDGIAEPILLLRSGTVTFANDSAQALLGRHIVGEDVRVAIRHRAAADQFARTDDSVEPVELAGLGGADKRWEMRTAHAAHGARVVHLVDQTGNYAAERMRVDFVANASHELRTPLASILGFIETLNEDAGDDPDIRGRFLKVMFDEAQRMQRLVEDLISLSRIEAEKFRAPADSVDLATLIERTRCELVDGGDARADDLAVITDPAVPAITGDRAQLSQLLHNLIGNAMKYGRAGTPVTIALTMDGERALRLTIADQGEGIAAEHIPRLTERFYRVDAGRSRSVGGTGLGLAIAKHIIERHRGRLNIASTPGVGTTVSVTMPIAAAAASGPVIKA